MTTRVTAPRKGRAALVRVTKEAKKEKLKARMLVSGQHSFEPSISASACFLFLADNLCNLFGLSLCLDMWRWLIASVCIGNMHSAAMHTINYSSKPGEIGIGGRFFNIKGCIDHLVSKHGYDRERAQRMCFVVGLTLFPAEKALRCCGVGPSTPGHERGDSKYYAFPRNFASERRRIGGNGAPGDFCQPTLS